MGYVTPWNSRGYDVAKTSRHKFTHISPVWYQLRGGSGSAFHLAGGHDVDQGWISDVRQPHAQVKSIFLDPPAIDGQSQSLVRLQDCWVICAL